MPVRDPSPGLFLAAIESVLHQTWSHLELIVIETPGQQALSEILAPIRDERLKHVIAPDGITTSIARNLAIAEASGDLLAMLDADDLCNPDRIAKQVRFLEEHADVDVVGSSIEIIDEQDRVLGTRNYPLQHEEIFEAMRLYNPLAQPSVMMRKRVITKHGGYDERPDCICEDYDLWSRLARKGVRFANQDETLTRYRMHSSATKSQRLRESLRDTLRIKKTYWEDLFDLKSRFRYGMEKILLWLPRSLVMALFKRLYVKPY